MCLFVCLLVACLLFFFKNHVHRGGSGVCALHFCRMRTYFMNGYENMIIFSSLNFTKKGMLNVETMFLQLVAASETKMKKKK